MSTKQKKLYEITFTGIWLGGTAIVRATDEKNAEEIFREEAPTNKNDKIYKITKIPRTQNLVHFFNGDY